MALLGSFASGWRKVTGMVVVVVTDSEFGDKVESGSNEMGRLLCLAGAIGNSYLVWLGRSKLNVGNETVRILFLAIWPQLGCWICSAHERMLTGRPGT